jgi:CheY-like chemotaxis protein
LGDPDKLRRVLINLIDNTVKFTEKGSVTVSLIDRPDGMIQFSIADTGIGLSEEEKSAIFNPFTQADQSIARLYGGTGLGTTISKELVNLMGGEIWVDSEPGRGSTFHFTLPKKIVPCPEDVLDEGHEFLDPQEPILFRPTRRFKILMAEDVEENAALAAVRLIKQGHQVRSVSNGTEAVEAYRSEAFDLILMDIHMPGMDGLAATIKIREITPPSATPVPVIALTASVMEEDRKLYRDAGISGVIGKPINFQELFSLMEDLVPDGYGEPWRQVPEGTDSPGDPSLPPLDQAKALAMWQYPGLYQKALTSFIVKYEDAALDLEKLIREEKQDEAFRLAHNLKGLAGTLALPRLQISAGLLDGALRKGPVDPEDPGMQTLRDDLKEAVGAIKAYLDDENPAKDKIQQEPQ